MTGTPLLFVRIQLLFRGAIVAVHFGPGNTAHEQVVAGTAPFGGLADSAMEFALHRHHRPLPV